MLCGVSFVVFGVGLVLFGCEVCCFVCIISIVLFFIVCCVVLLLVVLRLFLMYRFCRWLVLLYCVPYTVDCFVCFCDLLCCLLLLHSF